MDEIEFAFKNTPPPDPVIQEAIDRITDKLIAKQRQILNPDAQES
jgi:hypothetical protein